MGIFVPAVSGAATADVAIKTIWGPAAAAQLSGSTAALTTVVLNDADNSVASVFVVPRDGTIDRIGVNLSAVTGTPSINVGLVTLDASGNPTTTAYGSSAAKAVTAWSTGWQWITLDTPATAVAGDRIAARIWPSGAGNVPDGSHNVTIRSRFGLSNNASIPNAQEWATAWAKTVSHPMVAVRYSDGVVAPIIALSATAILTSNFSSSTSPDEQGGLFQVPFTCRCVGARVWFDPNSAACTATVKLYDGANALLASALVTAAEMQSTALGWVDVFWDAVALTKDTNYRLTHLATSTDNRQVPEFGTPDTDSKTGVPEGSRWQKTTRHAAGAWTDTVNTVPVMAIRLDQVTVPG